MRRVTTVLAIAAFIATLLPAVANARSEEVVSRAAATYPYLGVVADVEKVATDDGLVLRATSNGKPVDMETLAADDATSRRKELGALDPTLARHLEKLDDDQLVPVALWLAEDERSLGDRPKDGPAGGDRRDLGAAKRAASERGRGPDRRVDAPAAED